MLNFIIKDLSSNHKVLLIFILIYVIEILIKIFNDRFSFKLLLVKNKAKIISIRKSRSPFRTIAIFLKWNEIESHKTH